MTTGRRALTKDQVEGHAPLLRGAQDAAKELLAALEDEAAYRGSLRSEGRDGDALVRIRGGRVAVPPLGRLRRFINDVDTRLGGT